MVLLLSSSSSTTTRKLTSSLLSMPSIIITDIIPLLLLRIILLVAVISTSLQINQHSLVFHTTVQAFTTSSTTIIPVQAHTNHQRYNRIIGSYSPLLLSTSLSSSTTTTTSSSSSSSSAEKMGETTNDTDGSTSYQTYTDDELKAAFYELNTKSTNIDDHDNDCRHIYGYNDINHNMSVLQKITATVYLDYKNKLSEQPSIDTIIKHANEFATKHGSIINLYNIIQESYPIMSLAAEFKRASPSKGDIAINLNAGEQGVLYANAGANIISCLTESRWFKGSLQDLTEIRLQTNNNKPQRPAILRKDFIINKYMIAEAAAAGADTVLLIVAVLPESLLKELINYSRSLGMEPLVEVHADNELEVALNCNAKVIGVNNRNLHTFQVDMSTTERIAEQLQQCNIKYIHDGNIDENSVLLCALSGMSNMYDVHRYRQIGVGMCLIGESLMRASDPQSAIKSLCLNPNDYQKQLTSSIGGGAYTGGTQIIKVCGITNTNDALIACQSGANLIGIIFAEKSKRKVTIEQAYDIVQTVRTFGERSKRIEFINIMNENENEKDNIIAPLPHIIASINSIVPLVKQRPAVVGVFQNQDPDYICDIIEQVGLDMIQLHGQEGMEAANRKNYNNIPVIRVMDIAVDPTTGKASDNAAESILQAITNDPAAILLDTSIKGVKDGGGGTGVAFDWSIAKAVQNAGLPVIVAGGLTADTITDCISTTSPFGVDVSSGVEQEPGRKDHDKVRAFVQNAKKAAAEAMKGF